MLDEEVCHQSSPPQGENTEQAKLPAVPEAPGAPECLSTIMSGGGGLVDFMGLT